MKLIIVRHAIAEQRQESNSEEQESQRPLTDEGRRKFRKAAAGLKDSGVNIDLILSSPYVRATDTARILHKKFQLDDDKLIMVDDLTPVGDAKRLVKEIGGKYAEAGDIALVGHEPGLSRLISTLLSGSPDLAITLKKGGVCQLSLEKLEYGRCATLEWLLAPGHLVRLAD